MTNKMPPVPPANRSDKGPGSAEGAPVDTTEHGRPHSTDRNLAEQGRQGNIKQNTTNQGYQQDR